MRSGSSKQTTPSPVWCDDSNWVDANDNPASIPAAGDNVTILADSNLVVIQAATCAGEADHLAAPGGLDVRNDLTVQSADVTKLLASQSSIYSVSTPGTFKIHGDSQIYGTLEGGGTYEQDGTLTTLTATVRGSTLVNQGHLLVSGQLGLSARSPTSFRWLSAEVSRSPPRAR